MSNDWCTGHLNGNYFEDLRARFDIHNLNNWPDTDWFTNLMYQRENVAPITFVDNEHYLNDSRYYEQIINEDKVVPTRSESWHDLFNALVWSLFPNTKQLLNQQHMEDIRKHGLMPRTRRRNHITHFDECGVVLAFSNSNLINMLNNHQWMQAFHDQRALWGTQIRPFVFGHANYEMLLSPFLGLTGKWVGVEVEERFFDMPLNQQYSVLDTQLVKSISNGLFSCKGCLKPLPLLGIPEWHKDNSHSSFYDNTDYFRAKRV
jgi:hypothetical protein